MNPPNIGPRKESLRCSFVLEPNLIFCSRNPVHIRSERRRPAKTIILSIDKFSVECVCFFGDAVQPFGISPTVGQIYGLLFASPDPLSFSDIFDRLDISKGSVSQGLNLLRSLGAAYTVEGVKSNGRREYFAPEVSLRKLLRGIFEEKIGAMVDKTEGRLEHLRALANTADEKTRRFKVNRIQQLVTWRRRLRAVAPVLGALLGPKA